MARVLTAAGWGFCLGITLLCVPQVSDAQVIRQAIGGVEISPNGVLEAPSAALVRQSAEQLRRTLRDVPANLSEPTEFRSVSLKGIQQQIEQAMREGRDVSDDVRYLGGLTQIQFVVVDPEAQDILLAGPAEPWEVNAAGIVVGSNTKIPVLQLDDLLIALRHVERARTEGITCSIDPTTEGRQRLEQMLSRQRQFSPAVVQAIEQALGLQEITITGVPTDSHFARVLAAADFRMKRFAMMLEPAPINNMPSFLELIQKRQGGLNNMMPRWWIAGSYDPLGKSDDGLIWELRGRRVQVLTEDEIISRAGQVTGSGQVNPVAQRWADTMTERYEELAQVDSVFGQLQNLMDISLVAALIAREDLCAVAGCDLALIQHVDSGWETASWPAPRTVASQGSFIKVKREYIVTASGGVQVESWAWASNAELVPNLADRVSRSKRPDRDASSWTW